MLIYAYHEIWHALDRNFITTNQIDEVTGDYRIKIVPTKLKPEMIYEVPDDLGNQVIRTGHAREPTAEEIQLYRLANPHAKH